MKRKVSFFSLHSFIFLLSLSFPYCLSLLLLEAAFRNYQNQSKIWVILGNYCRRFYESFPFAFSRNERAHPNFVCSREKSDFSQTASWPPRPLDTKTKLGHFCSLCWLLSFCSTFWSYLWTGFHSGALFWLHSTKKGMQSQCRLHWDFLTTGEKELHHRKARVYETICVFDRSRLLVCSSFGSGPMWTVRGLFGQDAR